MPGPIELLKDPITLAIFGMYIALMIWEAVFPGRELPKVRFWKIRGIAVFFVYFFLSSYLPYWWSALLPGKQMIDLSVLGNIGGAMVGILFYEFGMYVWHRAMHNNNYLWRMFHQMHHSAERLDTYGAFYFSPLDIAGWTALGTICFSVILGLTAQAVTITLLVTNFFSIFQHANIRTPVWLGYIIQRPESHTVHHAKGIHGFNYSDLPLFDMLFGTFRNPSTYKFETGFYNGASSKIKDMLLFKNIDRTEQQQDKSK